MESVAPDLIVEAIAAMHTTGKYIHSHNSSLIHSGSKGQTTMRNVTIADGSRNVKKKLANRSILLPLTVKRFVNDPKIDATIRIAKPAMGITRRIKGASTKKSDPIIVEARQKSDNKTMHEPISRNRVLHCTTNPIIIKRIGPSKTSHDPDTEDGSPPVPLPNISKFKNCSLI